MSVRRIEQPCLASVVFSIFALAPSYVFADQAIVRFDVPAIAPARVVAANSSQKQITVDWTLSALVVDALGDGHDESPPIDHLLVRCRLRDRLPVVGFSPRTEVRSDYAGPISVTEKREKTEAFGLSMDGKYHPIAGAHLGADESSLQSDATQYQHNAPVQAVVASGTIDRGYGVYFKLRWTRGQVLEGEKHFQVTFAAPRSWRGGLLDVEVLAAGIDRQFMSKPKVKSIAQEDFVVAVHEEQDAEAAMLATRLASLDRELRRHAEENHEKPNAIRQLWRDLFDPKRAEAKRSDSWYHRLSSRRADPYVDREIRKLPMSVRVSVIDYSKAAERLASLGDSS